MSHVFAGQGAEAGGFEPPVPRGTLAFKVQRRSAVGRSRAGQRSGVVRARPTRRRRVVVSVDVNGPCEASLAGHPGDLPATGRGRPLRPEGRFQSRHLRVTLGGLGQASWANQADPRRRAGKMLAHNFESFS